MQIIRDHANKFLVYDQYHASTLSLSLAQPKNRKPPAEIDRQSKVYRPTKHITDHIGDEFLQVK